MAEIFVSYARSSEAQAHRLAEALRGAGYGVWRDDQLPAHRAYADVIEERLRAAKAVIVLWSADAAKSQWVRAEADVARAAGTLVQLTLDGAALPLPFNQIQCADFRDWAGETDHLAWRKVLASVEHLVGRDAVGAASAAAPPPPSQALAAKERLLAVLAFDNLSNDPEMAYFSDGVSEEILQTVGKLPGLKVVGRSSSFQFRGAEKAVARVAADLQATHVLDGSVRRSGDRVRISASLVECRGQTTVWSERFDRDLSDVFALQDEIATAVAEALELAFSPTDRGRKVDPKAYDLYLRARSISGAHMREPEAIELLQAATARAPDFAEAWASLAAALALSACEAGPDAPADRARALEAAERASALNPDLGLTWIARSFLEPDGAYLAREALVDKALATSPTDPELLKHASDFAGAVGRTRESFRLIARAYANDPLNRVIAVRHSGALSWIGLFSESYEAAEAGRARWPDFDWLIASPLLISAFVGDWAVADPLIELARARGGSVAGRVIAVVSALRDPSPANLERLLGAARRQLDELGAVDPSQIMVLHRAGLQDEAFELVSKSSYAHIFTVGRGPLDHSLLPGVLFGSMCPELRRDPRFIELCGKIGLCAYWTETGRWPDCADDRLAYDFRAMAAAYVARDGAVETKSLGLVGS
ncbi:MAG: TIR domain-containing protein [Caulobacterales bacterium]